jgi:hypothetical protein
MLIVTFLRYYITKLMYSQDSPLLKSASISFKVLRNTILQSQADPSKQPIEGEQTISKALETIKDEVKDK